MQNCYSSGKVPREFSEQDERLTKKHIETLKFVQEIAVENKELKARIVELEKEGSQCSELHALARNSQTRIKEIQEQYMARADEINQMLTEKHKIEVMKKVEEKMVAEKHWTEDKKELLAEIEQLKKENQRLKDELDIARDQKGHAESLQSTMAMQAEQIRQLKEENARLELANQNQLQEIQRLQYVDARCRTMSEQISEQAQHNKELKFQIERLERELEKCGGREQDDFLNALRSKLAKLHLEKQESESRKQDHEAMIAELVEELERLRKAHGDSERMRADLKVQYDALLQEMNGLKRQTSGDRQTFQDFVKLKRDMAALLEENEELKIKLKLGRAKRQSLKHNENVMVTVAKLDTGGAGRRESTPSYSKR